MFNQRKRGRIFGGVGVFLVGQPQDCEGGDRFAGQNLTVDEAQDPVAATAAGIDERGDNRSLAPSRLREPQHCREIPLKIAASDTETGGQVAVWTDTTIKPQRRRNLVPVGSDPLGQVGKRVGDAH